WMLVAALLNGGIRPDSEFVTRAVPGCRPSSWIGSYRGERTSSQPLASPRVGTPGRSRVPHGPDSAVEIVAVDKTAGIILHDRLERQRPDRPRRDSTSSRI